MVSSLGLLIQSRQKTCSCFCCPWKQRKAVGIEPEILGTFSSALLYTQSPGVLSRGAEGRNCCFSSRNEILLVYPRTPVGLVLLHVLLEIFAAGILCVLLISVSHSFHCLHTPSRTQSVSISLFLFPQLLA